MNPLRWIKIKPKMVGNINYLNLLDQIYQHNSIDLSIQILHGLDGINS